ncbi:MAG: SprB repeat-containing protein [Bacteroidetes bacterium]|nr:SprB repeat-containing protein [Bacteroidota bacterium]
MTTTTNFKKWAGYLLLTGIFLFSSMEHVSAYEAPVCVPIGVDSFQYTIPRTNCEGKLEFALLGESKESQFVIRENVLTIFPTRELNDTTISILRCCLVLKGDVEEMICDTVDIRILFNREDSYEGPSVFYVCDTSLETVLYIPISCPEESLGGSLPTSRFFFYDGLNSTFTVPAGLNYGTYNFNICCDSCCEEVSIIVGEGIVFTYETDNALCGNDNGYFDITVVSGVAPYTYLWSNGATTEDLTGLAAGNYNVTITGANGCSITTAFVINSTTEVITSGNTVNATCDLDNGEINVTVTSGTAPFNFLWNDGATTEDRNGLAGGNYSVTVTDVNGCIASQGFTINKISAPSLSLKGVTDETCGQGNGGIGFNVIGGVAPFTYLWNDGSTLGTRDNLSAGKYTVTLTDANGCTASLSATVNNINGPNASSTIVDASCGLCDGSINLTVTGGTAPYTFIWDDGITTEDRTSLCAGTYGVVVTDAKGCIVENKIDIAQKALNFSGLTLNHGCLGENGYVCLTYMGLYDVITISDGLVTCCQFH